MKQAYQQRLSRLLKKADKAVTNDAKGKALEDAVEAAFCAVSGITLQARDKDNSYQSEEIDLAFWNEKEAKGLHFLPNILLVEAKNWSKPAGAKEVAWFVEKLRDRCLDFGIFVAAEGVTGDPKGITAARDKIRTALKDGIKVIVMKKQDIMAFKAPGDLVSFLKTKMCELVVSCAQN